MYKLERISKFQLYCLLVILLAPVAVLEQPHRMIHIAQNNGWLVILLAIFPSLLIALMFSYIIKKSSQPFPMLLEEHLGKIPGKTMGSLYIFVFFLTCAFNLRVFIEFMKMIVLPATPISIFIGVILLLGFFAIKMSLQNLARISEIILFFGLTFTILITVTACASNFNPERIYPIANMSFKTIGLGLLVASSIIGKMLPVLSLAFFLPEKKSALMIMVKVVCTYILLLALVTFAVIITLGTYPARTYVFPTFNMIRLSHIGDFIQNLDIVFISVWITGILGAVTISWFMGCYTAQKVFNLQDYRFLAAPSSLIIGVLSIIIGANNLEVVLWSLNAMPFLFTIFFILIPLLLFLICCFKSVPGISAPEPENSPDPLNKQGMAG